MAAPSPGTYGSGIGSSSSSGAYGGNSRNVADEFDGDEAADLGQENALLAEDPMEEERERTQ